MTTTTTTTTTTEPTRDWTDITTAVDHVIACEGTESDAWITLHDLCESTDDPSAAWTAARDHYVTTYPTGKRGKTTRPADTFKARKADVVKVRKTHPRMTAAQIVDNYGSVRSAATAIRTAERAAAPAAPATTPAEPTPAERLAQITAAVRLAVAAGASDDDITAAVAAARTS